MAEEIQSTGVVLSYFFTCGVPYFLLFFSHSKSVWQLFDRVDSLYFFWWESWDKFPLFLYSFVLRVHYSWWTMKLSFHGLRLWLSNIVFGFLFISFIYLFFYSVVAERNCLPLDSCLDKYIVLQVWLLLFFFSGLFSVWGVFQFWSFGLSSRICNLFIRHSSWTTVTSAGFRSGPRPVFPVGQPPLLGF